MINIEVAGLSIGIDNRYRHIERISKDYITEKPPFFTVTATEEQIRAEQSALEAQYSPEVLESTAIFGNFAERLPLYDAAVFHGAVIAYEGKAYAVTARSGVGKTTHLRLWLEEFGDKVHILNGDKPILRIIDGVPYACATPWRGKEGYGVNEMLPLGGIALLRRAPENSAKRISASAGCVELMSQIYAPRNPEGARLTLLLLNRLVTAVPLYEFFVNMQTDAARVALKTFLNN